MGTFRSYGENTFTFLFFSAVHEGDLVQKVLLPSLRQFATGHQFEEPLPVGAEADVWLFPNFGRRYGFGEPDALLLLGKWSFWFEVETWVDVQTRRPALKKSLLQLARFHYFWQALSRGGRVRRSGVHHRAIVGPTVSNDGTVKEAVLKVKGHPVLQSIRKRLAESLPYYVLLTQGKPRGLGGTGRFEGSLGDVLREVGDELEVTLRNWAAATGVDRSHIPERLRPEQCWYSYWNGHLRDRLAATGVPDPLITGGYVGVRK